FIHFEPNGNRWLLDRWTSYIFYESDQGWLTFAPEEHGAGSGNYTAFFTHPMTGDFWLASANGISRYDGQQWHIFKPTDLGKSTDYVTDMVVDAGGIVWAVTYQALYKIENNQLEIFIEEIPEIPLDLFRSLAIDGANSLWVGLHDAIARFENQSWTIFDQSNSGVPNGVIGELEFDDWGNLWIGSQQGGLAVYNHSGLPAYLSDDLHENSQDSLISDIDPEFEVFPNPVSRTNHLKVRVPGSFNLDNTYEYKLFNSLGQLVITGSIDSHWLLIPLQGVEAAGTYVLQIRNDKDSFSTKVIIH
ncbi:MAG: T9SS type A sorting domain-containing protein, partial [Saprospiraceae bacterium]|nr:T9SS type A sorting domain-containing protein [Saprospiraceae bacterium]